MGGRSKPDRLGCRPGQDERPDELRVAARRGPSHIPAERQSDDNRRAAEHGRDDVADVVRRGLELERPIDKGAVTGQVDRDDAELVRERRHLRAATSRVP